MNKQTTQHMVPADSRSLPVADSPELDEVLKAANLQTVRIPSRRAIVRIETVAPQGRGHSGSSICGTRCSRPFTMIII